MASMCSFSMVFLFIVAIITSIPGWISSTVGSSTFSKIKDSVCTRLPFNISNPPDVWLNVPNLSVDRISLVVENLKARVSLSGNIASLVSLNAGVDVSIDKVNLTIEGVKTQVQLAMHLDNVAKIIARTMASLDLNPLLTSITEDTFKSVSNLLSVFTDNGQVIYQIINSVGKIINQVIGSSNEILLSTAVGDYQKNMTFTGVTRTLENGYVIKQYSYPSPSGSITSENILVNTVFDIFGNVSNTYVVNPPSLPSQK